MEKKNGKAKKVLVLLLCALLLVGASIAGTVAYLTSTDDITNTFTVGNVKITLKENEMNVETGKLVDADSTTPEIETTLVDGITGIKIMPNREIQKQPVIVIDKSSESCWLFVKIENGADAEENVRDILGNGKFTTSTGWTAVNGADGWYQYSSEVAPMDADQDGDVDDVNVKVFENFIIGDLNNDEVAALNGASIKVTAYAIQSENIATVGEAWTALGTELNPPTNP